ncbi:prepilin peptidase [Bifidobacterium felsineum]|uniref:Peptidase A24 n=1 Tax=Bifidobacterium felsineum TaxID=2045440 RepID=A0A2M9HKQ0_9BIFI|nr:prepilin peptidase [Bifidobacterium felsineum]MBT1163621.1 prepilin peptidase [Bifidobacterium felsineum]PJM77351.1 peptidase A24 [Bifidobacterium felsineum]
MAYLFTLPGLLCELALSIEDMRTRRVPWPWVASGALLQLIAVFIYGVMTNDLFAFLQALLFTVLCCLIQCALALIVPRSLGFGDVTALVPIGLAVGMFGLSPVVIWWLAMGVCGLIWIGCWTKFTASNASAHTGKVPYVPVIFMSAIIALALNAIV